MQSRRRFLQQSTLAAGASVIGAARRSWSASFSSAIDPVSIESFRTRLNGPLILPTDADYDAARAVAAQNPETDKRPALIVQPGSEQDILRSIDFAHKHDLEVAVRSGNHSFLGWGTCNGGMVIDLSRMKGVTVDPARKTAVVRTGSNAGEILASTARFGLAPVLGECPTVGAGLALGGGLGWLSGQYGATCDNLLSALIVTADAKILSLDKSSYPDLFWAIRGGGGNFGIATEFQYQLHPVNAVLAGKFIYPASKARTMFRAFRDWMEAAPDELQAECHLMSDNNGQFHVEMVYSGDPQKGEALVNQFRKLHPPDQDTLQRRRYADLYSMAFPPGLPSWKFQFVKAAYIESVSDGVIDSIVERFAQRPPNCKTAFNFDHYMHGQVCRIPVDATAFSLRRPGA